MNTLTLLMALMLGLLTVPGEENSNLAKENGYVINLDRAEKLEKMTYSSLFSKAGIIVLEDTDESLLGKVDKLEVCDNNLYVLEKGRGLFLFNKQGKFIKMIGRQGKGPGEYIDPDDISIDRENKKIYVLDSQTQNVLVMELLKVRLNWKIKEQDLLLFNLLRMRCIRICIHLINPGNDFF